MLCMAEQCPTAHTLHVAFLCQQTCGLHHPSLDRKVLQGTFCSAFIGLFPCQSSLHAELSSLNTFRTLYDHHFPDTNFTLVQKQLPPPSYPGSTQWPEFSTQLILLDPTHENHIRTVLCVWTISSSTIFKISIIYSYNNKKIHISHAKLL